MIASMKEPVYVNYFLSGKKNNVTRSLIKHDHGEYYYNYIMKLSNELDDQHYSWAKDILIT